MAFFIYKFWFSTQLRGVCPSISFYIMSALFYMKYYKNTAYVTTVMLGASLQWFQLKDKGNAFLVKCLVKFKQTLQTNNGNMKRRSLWRTCSCVGHIYCWCLIRSVGLLPQLKLSPSVDIGFKLYRTAWRWDGWGVRRMIDIVIAACSTSLHACKPI
jgi:hypothetical protein